MILETGRVVAIEADGLWVETIQRSTCNSCRAEQGCGQSMMAKLSGHTSYLRVLLQGRDAAQYHLGEEVQIGVPEDVIANGSLFVYLVPLIAMLLCSGLAEWQFAHEGLTILAGLIGLISGGVVIKWRAYQTRDDSRLQPVLIDNLEPLKFSS